MINYFKRCPLTHAQKGVGILAISMVAMTVGNCFVHSLSCQYSCWNILFYKSLWAFFVLMITRRNDKTFFKSILQSSFKPNMMRALFGSLGVILWIRSVQCLPLQDVSTLSLTSSFFSAFGGYLFYKEKMNRYKNGGLILGFIGAYIIIHPHFQQQEWLYIFPLLSALCFGASALLARYLATRDQEYITSFYLFLTMILVAIPFGATFLANTTDYFVLMIIGISYGISQLLYVKAYVYSEASYLASFKYLKVPLHSLAGILFFYEIPTFYSMIGMSILIFALLYTSKKR